MIPLLLIQVLANAYLWFQDYTSFAGDGYLRLYLASSWARYPKLFIAGEFLPFYFYFYGLAVKILGDVIWAGRIVTLLFSLAFSGTFYLLARKLLQNSIWAFIALGLVQASTLFLRITTSAQSEPMGLFFIVLSVVLFAEWRDHPRPWSQRGIAYFVLCQVSMFIACGIRYEAWLAAGVLDIFLCISFVRRRPNFLQLLIGSLFILLPLLIPPLWFMIGKEYYGAPARFVPPTSEVSTMVTNLGDPWFYGRFLWGYYPQVIFLAVFLPFGWMRIRGDRKCWPVAALALTFAGFLLVVSFRFARAHFAFPERTLLFFVTFAVLVCLLACRNLWGRRFEIVMLTLTVLALAASSVRFVHLPPPWAPEALALGKEIRNLSGTGWIRPEDKVLFEKIPDEWPVMFVESGLAGRVYWDRKATFDRPMNVDRSELLDMSPDELRATVVESGVNVFAFRNTEAVERIRAVLGVVDEKRVGEFRILRRGSPR